MGKMNNNTEDTTLVVTPKSRDTRWIALSENDVIISEGKTPTEVIEEAKKITKEYTLMYVPMEGNACFF